MIFLLLATLVFAADPFCLPGKADPICEQMEPELGASFSQKALLRSFVYEFLRAKEDWQKEQVIGAVAAQWVAEFQSPQDFNFGLLAPLVAEYYARPTHRAALALLLREIDKQVQGEIASYADANVLADGFQGALTGVMVLAAAKSLVGFTRVGVLKRARDWLSRSASHGLTNLGRIEVVSQYVTRGRSFFSQWLAASVFRPYAAAAAVGAGSATIQDLVFWASSKKVSPVALLEEIDAILIQDLSVQVCEQLQRLTQSAPRAGEEELFLQHAREWAYLRSAAPRFIDHGVEVDPPEFVGEIPLASYAAHFASDYATCTVVPKDTKLNLTALGVQLAAVQELLPLPDIDKY